MERAQTEEKKISELEEELRVVGSNLQQLEVEGKRENDKRKKLRDEKSPMNASENDLLSQRAG